MVTPGSPEALAAEGTYLHCHQAPDDTEPLASEGREAWGPHRDLTSTWGWPLCQCWSDSLLPAPDRTGSMVVGWPGAFGP